MPIDNLHDGIINLYLHPPASSTSLKAVITMLNPFPEVPHESVTYLSVTKLVNVKRIPFSLFLKRISDILEGVSVQEMLA